MIKENHAISLRTLFESMISSISDLIVFKVFLQNPNASSLQHKISSSLNDRKEKVIPLTVTRNMVTIQLKYISSILALVRILVGIYQGHKTKNLFQFDLLRRQELLTY